MTELFGPVTPFLLLTLISGLVEFAKQVSERGSLAWPQVLALVLGLLFGSAYVLVYAPAQPVTAAIFQAVVYGPLLGLAATGIYDIAKKLAGAARNVNR